MSAFSYTNGGWRNLAFAKVYKDEAWKEIKFTDKIRKNLEWHTILDDTYTFLFKRHSVMIELMFLLQEYQLILIILQT